MTYVALVPFDMKRPWGRPRYGSLTSVRPWSLETGRRAVVPLTRLGLGVPYTWARMRSDRRGDQLTYRSVRRWPRRGLHSRLTIRVGEVVEPTPLGVWLTVRWSADTQQGDRTWWHPVSTSRGRCARAKIVEQHDDLPDASGVPPTAERLRVLCKLPVPLRLSCQQGGQ